MATKFFSLLVLSYLVLFTAGQAFGADTAHTLFQAGKIAFQKKKFKRAVELYQNTLLKGLQTPAVYHNLGVAAYKAKLYGKAKIAFKENLKNREWRALAQYNLGLIAKKQQQKRQAIKWFQLASQSKENQTISQAASIVLARMNVNPTVVDEKDWFILAQVGTGYEDHVVDILNEQIATDANNHFYELSLFSSKSWGTSKKGVDFNTSIFTNSNQTDTDLTLLSMGAERYFRLSTLWKRYTGVNFYYTVYQGDVFQANLSSHIKLKRSNRKDEQIFSLQYQLVRSLNQEFDHLQGNQWNFRSEWRRRGKKIKYRLYYDFESDQRNGAGFSPDRHRIHFRTELPRKKFSLQFSLDLRSSTYDDNEQRTDRRIRTSAKSTYRISKNLNYILRYEFQTQQSSDKLSEVYNYDRQRLVTGFELFY